MQDRLREAIGMADLYELMAAAFDFPTPELAEALSSGAFMADWSAAWQDATGEQFRFPDGLSGASPDDHAALRKEYSRLYLMPGGRAPVWPYENCFKYREEGRRGLPSLFRSPDLIDVERQMREAGVQPSDVRTEPADSMFKEFAFMSFLYGKCAEALDEADRADDASSAAGGAASQWAERARRFNESHLATWIPSFMEQTAQLSRLGTYRVLAELGSALSELTASDSSAR